jgi:hypothetical protein
VSVSANEAQETKRRDDSLDVPFVSDYSTVERDADLASSHPTLSAAIVVPPTSLDAAVVSPSHTIENLPLFLSDVTIFPG